MANNIATKSWVHTVLGTIATGSKPPALPAKGMQWLNTSHNTLHIYDGNHWVQVRPGADGFTLTDFDKRTLLNNKQFLLDKIFLIFTPQYACEYPASVIDKIKNLGIDIPWTNSWNCMIAKNTQDANLIRISFDNLVSRIISSSEIIRDIENGGKSIHYH